MSLKMLREDLCRRQVNARHAELRDRYREAVKYGAGT